MTAPRNILYFVALATAYVMPSGCRKSKISKITPQSVEHERDKTAPTLTNDVVVATPISHAKTTLTWTKAADETSGQKNLYYKVIGSTTDNINTIDDCETMENGRFIALDWTKDIATATANDLAFMTQYYFNVIVADEAANKKVYSRIKSTSSGWRHEAYLKAPSVSNSDEFGQSVGISGDTVVVSAQYEDSTTTSIIAGSDVSTSNNLGSNNGAAYVFKRTGTTWAMEAYLKAPNNNNGNLFGAAAAIDGDTIVVGAFSETSTTTSIINGSDLSATNVAGFDNGAAYVFKRSGSTWTHEAYLKAPNNSNSDSFGERVAVAGDTVVVASTQEQSNTTAIINGSNLSSTNNAGAVNGAAYVFKRSGSTWTHEAYLKAPNNTNSNGFGKGLGISGDTIAVGAWFEEGNTTVIINGADLSAANTLGSQNGAVYVFKRSGTTWTHEAYLKAPNTTNSDHFGSTLAISNDTIAVGTGDEDSNTTDIINSANLGATNNSGSNNGAVYVFKRSGTTWTHEAYLKAPNTTNSDAFGIAVAIVNDTIAVGASGEDSNTTSIINGADLSTTNNSGADNGAVYVFQRSGSTWSHQAYLKAPNTTNGDSFGGSIAISGDTIAVGANGEDSNTTSIIHGSDLSATNNSGSDTGAVYIFR